MTDHKHPPHGHQHGHHGEGPPPPARKPFHKDWRLWVAVVLMLAGIAAYVLSLNESILPGGRQQQPVPAAP